MFAQAALVRAVSPPAGTEHGTVLAQGSAPSTAQPAPQRAVTKDSPLLCLFSMVAQIEYLPGLVSVMLAL